MKTQTIIYPLLILLIMGLELQLFPQTSSKTKTRVAVDKFVPFSETATNQLFEKNFPHFISLGFLNMKSIEMVSLDPVDEGMLKKSKKEKITFQQVYRTNNETLKKQADLIIYGDYSFTSLELFIVPKLYDVKNDKFYTLKSISIDDFNQGLKLTKLESLLTDYKSRIRSVQKSNQGLNKVGLLWAKKPVQNFDAYEESLFRSYVINITKTADTFSIVDILKWERLEPFYNSNVNYGKLAESVNADILYLMSFEAVKDFNSKVNIELFFKKTNKRYKIRSFEIDLLYDLNEEYFIEDFYGLLKDLKHDAIIDPRPLDLPIRAKTEFANTGLSFFNEHKHYLSNLMFYNALDMADNNYDSATYKYMIGFNYEKLLLHEGTYTDERIFRYYQDAIVADPTFKLAWVAIAPYFYMDDDYFGAANALLKVEQIDPDYYTDIIQYYIGYSYHADKQYSLALSYFKKAFELYNEKTKTDETVGFINDGIPEPKYIKESYNMIGEESYRHIVDIYKLMGDYEGADRYLSQFDESLRNKFVDNISRAEYYYQKGEDALYNYQYEIADHYLDIVDSIYQIDQDETGYMYSIVGDYNDLRRLTSLYINNYEKAYNITLKGIENNEFNESYIYLDNAVELTFVKSSDSTARYNEIIRYYVLHLEANPNDTLIGQRYNSIGYHYSLLGKIDSVAYYMDKALKINPEYLTAQLNKMEVYLVLNKFDTVYNTAKTIRNSEKMNSDLEKSSGQITMFYFLLVNAKLVDNKDYADDSESFKTYLKKEDFSTGWDFSIYEDWLNALSDAGDQRKLRSKYKQLKVRIEEKKYSY